MNELYHHGVKGMKWGVRNKAYNSSSRSRKKEIRKEYYKTPEGRIKKATMIGTMLGVPFGGFIARSITASKIEKEISAIKNNKLSSIDKNAIKKGRDFMQSQNIQQQVNRAMQESTRAAINAANQAASLGISGGTNPFMFGMM